MQRRLALKQMALALGVVGTLPTWVYGWNSQALEQPIHFLPTELETMLAQVVETIIPATDTPGAKELGVDKFILKMLSDCYDTPTQEQFTKGMYALEEATKLQFNSSFTGCTATQRTQVLSTVEKEPKTGTEGKTSFFPLLKNLTIQGYLNSAYVMKNLLKYELIPARFHGCFPVQN